MNSLIIDRLSKSYLRMIYRTLILLSTCVFMFGSQPASAAENRLRAREAGLVVGVFEPGVNNAITDVEGVLVGHETVIEGNDLRTGVTAIIPAPGNLYTHPIPAWVTVGNGYGKLIGETQIREFGELETPILLTCTLCVWSAANALKEWVYMQPGMGEHTVNPVVGETNDGGVNNMWADPIQREEVFSALANASSGPVAEGSVGAGTGTQAFGWKGGIGTSSRVLPEELGGYTVGVLVQTNYGGYMTINGAPVGRELGTYPYRDLVAPSDDGDRDDGSIMIVVATNAPLSARSLDRMGTRAIMGLGRTGSYASNGSGDIFIAFSTANPGAADREQVQQVDFLPNDALGAVFRATVEATEEAVVNALVAAQTMKGANNLVVHALPHERLQDLLKKHLRYQP